MSKRPLLRAPYPGTLESDSSVAKKAAASHPTLIVIGASAGGVDALQALAGGLPDNLRAAVLVVLHTVPNRHSHLHEVLDRAGPLPAKPAEDGEEVLGGRIYVAIPDRHLTVESGRIRLTRAPKEQRARPSIDVLFRSAAYGTEERVIGVILSGLLDDGTAGLWAIKDRGGISIVQAPEDARFSSMPRSALEHVRVDYCLSIEQLGPALGRLVNDELSGVHAPRIAADNRHIENAFVLERHLAGVDDEIDKTLNRAVSAINERALLLTWLGGLARADQDTQSAARYERESQAASDRAQQLDAWCSRGKGSI